MHYLTTSVGVSAGAGRALADGPVLDSLADGSADTGRGMTDGLALAVAAGMGAGTLFVHSAADLEASDERIASVAVGTGAHWFTVDDAADRVWSAVARALADTVAASRFRRAFVVCLTAGHPRRFFTGDGRDATAVCIQETVRRALTDNSPQRIAVYNAAQLSGSARLDSARIDAAFVDAHLFRRAFRVGSALRFWWADRSEDDFGDTADERIATLSSRTGTDGLMFLSGTDCCGSARDGLADFDADAVESVAHLCVVAVVMALTSNRNTDDRGIALHSGRAVALRSMEGYSAEGVRPALVSADDARIQALARNTGAVRRTVFISFTFSCKLF